MVNMNSYCKDFYLYYATQLNHTLLKHDLIHLDVMIFFING